MYTHFCGYTTSKLLLVLGPLLLPACSPALFTVHKTHTQHIYSTQKSRQRIGDSYCLSLDREGCQLKWVVLVVRKIKERGEAVDRVREEERRRRAYVPQVNSLGTCVCVCDGRYTHTHTYDMCTVRILMCVCCVHLKTFSFFLIDNHFFFSSILFEYLLDINMKWMCVHTNMLNDAPERKVTGDRRRSALLRQTVQSASLRI